MYNSGHKSSHMSRNRLISAQKCMKKTLKNHEKKCENNEPEIGHPCVFSNRSYFYVGASISFEAWYLQMQPPMSHRAGLTFFSQTRATKADRFLGELDLCPESRAAKF